MPLRFGPRTQGVVLLLAQQIHVTQSLHGSFDVPIEHGGVGVESEFMRCTVYIEPMVASNLSLKRLVVDTVVEDLCSTTGKRSQTCVNEVAKHSLQSLIPVPPALGDALQMNKFNSSERFEVERWCGIANR